MHNLIDEHMVQTIRSTGKTRESLPDRVPILRQYDLPFDRRATNVVITGCQILAMLPKVLATLARLFDRAGFSYTFLSREYCCGNYVYRPAIKARDESALAECRELSKEFLAMNVEQAEALGATRLVIFCSPCYPIYRHAFPDKEILFYPAALNAILNPMQFRREIDYYPGCYKLHEKFSPVPMDLESTQEIFAKMEGLRVNQISAPHCCFTPDGLTHMMDSIRTRLMVHICTGCYLQSVNNVRQDSDTKVVMLPDLVQMAQVGAET
jgi:Cysteine-rich domain